MKITKNRVKIFHDKHIMRKTFVPRQKVLLYDSRFHLFLGKLKSWRTGPFIVRTVFLHRAVKICDMKNGSEFKINGQRLKSFWNQPRRRKQPWVYLTQCISNIISPLFTL